MMDEPVGPFADSTLKRIFSDLESSLFLENRHLSYGTSAATKGDALEAIHHTLLAFGLETYILGENRSILRFKEAPLKDGLRITGRKCEGDAFAREDVPYTDDSCRVVHLHNDFATSEYRISDKQSLSCVLEAILSVWRSLNSPTGFFRPLSKSDNQLLSLLDHPDQPTHPRFAEASRAISKNCLLDACVEILTPFGLQPQEVDKHHVRFSHPAFQGDAECTHNGVRITRLDYYLCDERKRELGEMWTSCVVVTGLQSSGDGTSLDDRIHCIRKIVRETGLEQQRENGLLPWTGLVYMMCLDGDRENLVTRMLKYRDDWKRRWNGIDELNRMKWLGKQKPLYWRSEEEMEYLKSRRGKAKGNPSPLRMAISREDLEKQEVHEREEKTRKEKKAEQAQLQAIEPEGPASVKLLPRKRSLEREAEVYVISPVYEELTGYRAAGA